MTKSSFKQKSDSKDSFTDALPNDVAPKKSSSYGGISLSHQSHQESQISE